MARRRMERMELGQVAFIKVKSYHRNTARNAVKSAENHTFCRLWTSIFTRFWLVSANAAQKKITSLNVKTAKSWRNSSVYKVCRCWEHTTVMSALETQTQALIWGLTGLLKLVKDMRKISGKHHHKTAVFICLEIKV